MSKESHLLLESITAEADTLEFSYSEKKEGAGYYKLASPLHTVVYHVDSFKGTIKMQGTLAMYPRDIDWFDIENTEIGSNIDSSVWTTTQSVNFVGNFLWIRAAYNLQDGTIVSVRYNY